MTETELFNRKQAAKKLNISEDQLAGLVQDGELRYINVGRGQKRPRMRFADEDLDEFIARRRRREACLSGSPKTHRCTDMISGSEVIGFTAQRNARLAKKPRPLKP